MLLTLTLSEEVIYDASSASAWEVGSPVPGQALAAVLTAMVVKVLLSACVPIPMMGNIQVCAPVSVGEIINPY